MEDFLWYPQSTGKLRRDGKTYPFWSCQIVYSFSKMGPLGFSRKTCQLEKGFFETGAIYGANWQTEKTRPIYYLHSAKSPKIGKSANFADIFLFWNLEATRRIQNKISFQRVSISQFSAVEKKLRIPISLWKPQTVLSSLFLCRTTTRIENKQKWQMVTLTNILPKLHWKEIWR